MCANRLLSNLTNAATLTRLASVVFAMLVFVLAYFADPMRPGAAYPLGWYGSWFDQSKYYDMITSMPRGNLGEFRYPPLYPLSGALGGLVYSADPFFVPNLLFFAIFVYYSHLVFERFLTPSLTLASAAVVTLTSVDLFVTPWTSTVSAAALAALLFVAACGEYTAGLGLLAGLAAGVMFGARVGDVAVAAFVAISFVIYGRGKPGFARFTTIALASAAAVAAITVGINLKYDGRILGNYVTGILTQGFNFAAIPYKIYGYIVDSYVFHGETHYLSRPLVSRLPFLLFAPLGLYSMLRNPVQKRAGVAFVLALTGWLVVYVPFIALSALTLRYGAAHYAKMLFPVVIGSCFCLLVSLTPEDAGGKKIQSGPSLWKPAAIYTCALIVALFGMRTLKPRKLDLSSASLTTAHNAPSLRKAVDGDLTTRWDSSALQRPGIEMDLDLGRRVFVQRIVLDASGSPNDYPRKLSIWSSMDGKDWRPWWATNQSSTPARSDYTTDPRPARWLKFRLEAADDHYYWSVHELEVYGW